MDSDFNVVTLKGREAVDADPVGNELPWYPKAASGNATCENGGNGGVSKSWDPFFWREIKLCKCPVIISHF